MKLNISVSASKRGAQATITSALKGVEKLRSHIDDLADKLKSMQGKPDAEVSKAAKNLEDKYDRLIGVALTRTLQDVGEIETAVKASASPITKNLKSVLELAAAPLKDVKVTRLKQTYDHQVSYNIAYTAKGSTPDKQSLITVTCTDRGRASVGFMRPKKNGSGYEFQFVGQNGLPSTSVRNAIKKALEDEGYIVQEKSL